MAVLSELYIDEPGECSEEVLHEGIHNSNLLEAENYFIKLLKPKMDNHMNQTDIQCT